MCRDFGLTSRCSSSPGSSRLAISGITPVQHQWAPDGLSGCSVRRLIATRMSSYLLRTSSVGTRSASQHVREKPRPGMLLVMAAGLAGGHHRAGADTSGYCKASSRHLVWLAGLFAGETRQHKSALGVDVIRKTSTKD